MSAVGAPTHADPGKQRADFNLGNMNGATCSPEFMSFLTKILEGLGHSVSLNFPYYGGELVARHADPRQGIETKTAIAPDGRLALSGSLDHTMILWDVASGSKIREFRLEHNVTSGRLALSGDQGNGLLSRELKLWDLTTGRLLRVLGGREGHRTPYDGSLTLQSMVRRLC